MLIVDNVLVSDEILTEQFVCNLTVCKGACCHDGDAGAPLNKNELDGLSQNYKAYKPYMSRQGIEHIDKNGFFDIDDEFGEVTPTLNGGICAYGKYNNDGLIVCAIEQAFRNKETTYNKPISCHLFPIKAQNHRGTILLNYEPREDICQSGCSFGKKLKVPVFEFLKEPLTRLLGPKFYKALVAYKKQYAKPQK